MPGFRSLQHQGFVAAKTVDREFRNPYPEGSQARREYADGAMAYRAGKIIARDGSIADPRIQNVAY